MNVEYSLTRFFIAIEDQTVSPAVNAIFLSQLLCYKDHISHEPGIFFFQIVDGRYHFFRNDQNVNISLRIDVIESNDLIIFVNNICRYFPVDYLTEKCLAHNIYINIKQIACKINKLYEK